MLLQTIKSRDGNQIVHGIVTWRNGDEFGFVPQGRRYSAQWWCKTDYWELVEGDIPVIRLKVEES